MKSKWEEYDKSWALKLDQTGLSWFELPTTIQSKHWCNNAYAQI